MDAIEITDGRAQYVGKVDAWHQLGTVLQRAFSWEDVVKAAPTFGLQHELVPVYTRVDGERARFTGELAKVDGQFAVRREDGKVLGIVGDKYQIIQSHDAYLAGSPLGQDFGYDLRSVGKIRDGRQEFFTYDLGEDDLQGERVQHYLSIVNAYDASLSLRGLKSQTIIVCGNTMEIAMADAIASYAIRHTASAEQRIKAVRAMLGLAEVERKSFNALVTKLQDTEVSLREFDEFLNRLVPEGKGDSKRSNTLVTNQREAIASTYRYGKFAEQFRGTGWGAVQSVNSYEQWIAPVRGRDDFRSEADLRATRQFDAIVANKQSLTQKAVNLLTV